jgi:predicted nucleic acid-binding protein
MKRLVVDTGPVLHLHEAGALHLLPLIGETFLPPMVKAELSSRIPALPPKWAKLQTLTISAQQRALEWRHAGLLHGGEAEALALANEFKPDWFLTDDAAARLMAAAAKNLVKKIEAESFLIGLEKSSLWMSLRVRVGARTALEKLYTSSI